LLNVRVFSLPEKSERRKTIESKNRRNLPSRISLHDPGPPSTM